MGDSLESYNRYVKEQSSKGNENRSSFRPFHRIFQFIWPQESNRISQYKQILIRSTVFVLIIIIVIEVWEHVPSPKLTDVHMDNGTFPVIVKRDAAISIPLMSILFPTERNIEVDIYHNDSIHILNVGLSTNSSDSLLTYDFNFTNVTKKILPKPTVANSTNKLEEYYLDLTLYHNLGISNSSNPYILNIVYTNNTEDLHSLPLKFDLPVKTLDLNILSYFGLILIGVISSRTLTRVLESIEKKEEGIPQHEIAIQVLWIIFSFIIALLIFSSFKAQVSLTTNILTNISAAFAFGFGFDKVLEVAGRFINI